MNIRGRGNQTTETKIHPMKNPSKLHRTAVRWLLVGTLAASALTAHANFSNTVSSLNPIGWWRLNESGVSYSAGVATNLGSVGAAGNGSYWFAPALQQTGALGPTGDKAALFNGVNQFAEVPYTSALNSAGPFTVEFWANLTNNTAGAKSGPHSRLISGSVQQGWLFFANNGNTTWQFRIYNGTGAHTITATNFPAISGDTWYHVVGVYDGSKIHIYVNGIQTSWASATPLVYAPNTNAPMRFAAGTPETAPSLFFPGYQDEIAVYNYAFTAAQVQARYDSATTNAAGYAAQLLAANPLGYWRLNEPALPPMPKTANLGSLGSAQDGDYGYGVTNGVPGPRLTQFAGFEANNNAVSLNGSVAGLISIPGFATTTDTFTIAAWFRRQGSQVNASPIIGQRASGSPMTGLVVDFTDRLGYVWNDNPATYNFNPGPRFTIPDGLWTFGAMTISPSGTTLYLGTTNGLISTNHVVAHSPHDFSNGPLQIGRDGTSGTRLFRGGIDEVMLFNSTLDETSISNLFYSATPALFNVTRTPANPVFEGSTLTLTAFATAIAPLNYQWRKNGSPVGTNGPVLSVVNVSTNDSGNYDVVVTAGSQSVTSVVDAITVLAGPPVIFTQPQSLTRYAGASATFSVVAGGSTPYSYQWFKGASPIAGATNASLTITSVSTNDAGSYTVQVTNPYGTLPSSAATLTVLTVPNSYGPVALNLGAASYWRLNETSGTTAFDYAGSRHGTFPAPPSVTLGVAGVQPPTYPGMEAANPAYLLDGSTGWVTTPALNWTTNRVTFTAWVKLTGYDDDLSGVVFSRGASASGLDIRSDGELRYHWNGGYWGYSSGIYVPTNEWVFVALAIAPDGATLMMASTNGIQTAVNATAHPAVLLNDPLYLGRDRTDRPLWGAIDEVAIYQKTLTAAELSTLFAVGAGTPLEVELTPGGIVEDTKPVGAPIHGVNKGTGWAASSTDSNGTNRTGVALFSSPSPTQIVVPADPAFNSPTGTISFWFRASLPVAPGFEGAMLVDRRTTAGTVIVLTDAGELFIQCAGGVNTFYAGLGYADNNWHHVAVTYGQGVGEFITVYVDGALQNLQANTGAWSWPATQPIELGVSHDGYWKRLDGAMDDFRIYNRILDNTEVAALYTGALVDTSALKVRYNFSTPGIGQTVSWSYGRLQTTPSLSPAAWADVPGATLPSYPFLMTNGTQFFRAVAP